jgi:hypothetical protein
VGRTLHIAGVIVAGILGLGIVPCAQSREMPHDGGQSVTVLLYNDAGVPGPVLSSAEREAQRVFRMAAVETLWLNCGEGGKTRPDCGGTWGTDVFVMHIVVMHIVSKGASFKNDIFGIAFLTPGSSGKYCDVFYDRIEGMHRNSGASLPRLLGNVAAHELGHLLLGSNSHADLGIMSPRWQEKELRQLGMGGLLFTPQQAARMQESIAAKIKNPGAPAVMRASGN